MMSVFLSLILYLVLWGAPSFSERGPDSEPSASEAPATIQLSEAPPVSGEPNQSNPGAVESWVVIPPTESSPSSETSELVPEPNQSVPDEVTPASAEREVTSSFFPSPTPSETPISTPVPSPALSPSPAPEPLLVTPTPSPSPTPPLRPKRTDRFGRDIIFQVELEDGKTISLGQGWFLGDEELRSGDEVELDPKMGTKYDWEQLKLKGLEPGKKYKLK